MTRGFIFGVVATLLLIAAGALVAVQAGLVPANADARPSKLETWAAKTSLRATVAREAPSEPNPVALNDDHLTAGIKLYGANCAACHGTASGDPSNIAVGLYQHAPQLGKDGVEDDPEGVTFWKVKHGIRLTGMPGFSATLTDEQIWQLALFLKHMDKLPPAPDKLWHAMKNPAALAPASAVPHRRAG